MVFWGLFSHFGGLIIPIAEDLVVERHYSLPFFELLYWLGHEKVQPDLACIERVCVLIELFIILARRGRLSLNRIRSGVGDSVGYLGARKVIGMLLRFTIYSFLGTW